MKKQNQPPFIQMQKHREIVNVKNAKIRSLLQKNRRLAKKVEDLQSVIAQLKSNKSNENLPFESVFLSEVKCSIFSDVDRHLF